MLLTSKVESSALVLVAHGLQDDKPLQEQLAIVVDGLAASDRDAR